MRFLTLTPNNTLAPIIIVSVCQSNYRTDDDLVRAVTAKKLHVTKGLGASSRVIAKEVALQWRGKQYLFHASNQNGHYRFPKVDGVPVDISPPFLYEEPNL